VVYVRVFVADNFTHRNERDIPRGGGRLPTQARGHTQRRRQDTKRREKRPRRFLGLSCLGAAAIPSSRLRSPVSDRGPPEQGVPRGGVALAAWHTLWGSETGEDTNPSDCHRDPARPVPGLLPRLPDAPQGVPPLTARAGQQIGDLLASDDFDAWTETLARVGNCAKPIRLSGQSATVDTTTGDILSTHASAEEPLGSPMCGAATAVRGSARRVPGCTPRTCSTSSGPESRRQGRPRLGGRQPAGVHDADRPVLRAGARPRTTAAAATRTPGRSRGVRTAGAPSATPGTPRMTPKANASSPSQPPREHASTPSSRRNFGDRASTHKDEDGADEQFEGTRSGSGRGDAVADV